MTTNFQWIQNHGRKWLIESRELEISLGSNIKKVERNEVDTIFYKEDLILLIK